MHLSDANPFSIDANLSHRGIANLIVLDPSLLTSDPARAYNILSVGNDEQDPTIHIVFEGTTFEAEREMDDMFSRYIKAECSSLGCDAVVRYIDTTRDEISRTSEYGWDDGSYTITFMVHCNVPENATGRFAADLLKGTGRYAYANSNRSPIGYTLQGCEVVLNG